MRPRPSPSADAEDGHFNADQAAAMVASSVVSVALGMDPDDPAAFAALSAEPEGISVEEGAAPKVVPGGDTRRLVVWWRRRLPFAAFRPRCLGVCRARSAVTRREIRFEASDPDIVTNVDASIRSGENNVHDEGRAGRTRRRPNVCQRRMARGAGPVTTLPPPLPPSLAAVSRHLESSAGDNLNVYALLNARGDVVVLSKSWLLECPRASQAPGTEGFGAAAEGPPPELRVAQLGRAADRDEEHDDGMPSVQLGAAAELARHVRLALVLLALLSLLLGSWPWDAAAYAGGAALGVLDAVVRLPAPAGLAALVLGPSGWSYAAAPAAVLAAWVLCAVVVLGASGLCAVASPASIATLVWLR